MTESERGGWIKDEVYQELTEKLKSLDDFIDAQDPDKTVACIAFSIVYLARKLPLIESYGILSYCQRFLDEQFLGVETPLKSQFKRFIV